MNTIIKGLLAAFGMTTTLLCSAQAAEREIHVYNWDNYIAPDTLAKFTAETGIQVKYDIYADNETLHTALLAEKSGYDVVFPSASPFFATQVKIGLLYPLDYKKIPNAAGLDKTVMAGLGMVDRDNRYGIPYLIAATGFAYDAQRVKSLLPNAPTQSWSMLFDPKVTAKLSACGISLLDTPTEAIPAALAWRGLDPRAQTPDSLDAAMKTLAAIRPHVRQITSATYGDDLATGKICLSHGYVGDLVQARKKAQEAKPPRTLTITIPSEGAVVNVDVMAIPADAPHPDDAMAFINFLLRPDVMAAISTETGYANAVPASLDLIDPDIRTDPVIFPPESVRKTLFPAPPPANRDYNRARRQAWARLRASGGAASH